MYNEFLTPVQIEKVEKMCQDTELMDALQKVLLSSIYVQGTLQKGQPANPLHNFSWALSEVAVNNPVTDEILGQHLRGQWSGVRLLEIGFGELKKIKAEKAGEVESPYNEAE